MVSGEKEGNDDGEGEQQGAARGPAIPPAAHLGLGAAQAEEGLLQALQAGVAPAGAVAVHVGCRRRWNAESGSWDCSTDMAAGKR